MKKHIAIITILILVLSLGCVGITFAVSDNGADAHSPSMSVESGEEPIVVSEVEEADEVAVEAEEAIEAEVEEEDTATEEKHSFYPVVLILLTSVIIIGECIFTIRKKKKGKTAKKYESKH